MSAEFHEGDKLTFERGTSRVVAKVTPGTVSVCFESLPGSADVKWMTDMGWRVVSVEEAAPPLPTTPGWYATNFESNLLALFDDRWVEHSASRSWPRGDEYVRGSLKQPVERLERESVIAERVLDAIDASFIPGCDRIFTYSDAKGIARKFGATE